MKELKPCPFCGSKEVEIMLGSEKFIQYKELDRFDSVFVGCEFCGATSSHFEFSLSSEKGSSTKEEAATRAIVHWNSCSENLDLAFQLRALMDTSGNIDREAFHLLISRYFESQSKK